MSRWSGAADGAYSLPIEQRLDPRDFAPLGPGRWAANLASLGLYGCWGRSEIRRRIWAASRLGGEPFHYVGCGAELLVGLVIRWLVLGGALAAAAILALEPEPWRIAGALACLGAAAFLHGFMRFAAFVYLASRTEWRGSVFEVAGSPLRFALRELRDWTLAVATAGWWLPHAGRDQAEALWGGLRHHGQAVRFDRRAALRRPVYSAFTIGWFSTVVLLMLVGGLALGLAGQGMTPRLDGPLATLDILRLGAGALLLWLALVVVWSPYQAASRTAAAAGLGLAVELGWRESAWINLSNRMLLIGSLGVLAPLVQARTCAFVFPSREAVSTLAATPRRQAGEVRAALR
jgi:uncharacterized membrane protein YjgN (DUF898 family)